MEVRLKQIDITDKDILKDMLNVYLAEMRGESHEEYNYLDSYWEKKDRFPFFIFADSEIAGFALINSHVLILKGAKNIAEFYVKKEFRKKGVGSRAAKLIYDSFPGKWESRQLVENPQAHTFWLKLISGFTKNNFNEEVMDNEKWHGWIQTFDLGNLAKKVGN